MRVYGIIRDGKLLTVASCHVDARAVIRARSGRNNLPGISIIRLPRSLAGYFHVYGGHRSREHPLAGFDRSTAAVLARDYLRTETGAMLELGCIR